MLIKPYKTWFMIKVASYFDQIVMFIDIQINIVHMCVLPQILFLAY